MNSTATNPLLDFSGLPRFAAFDPTHVAPAIERLIEQARQAVAKACDPATPATWAAFVEPLESATEQLARAWGMVGHLNGVADSESLRAAYNEALPEVTEFWTELGQDMALFAKYRALHDSPEFAALDAARRKVVLNALRDFRLGGAELVSPARERFAQIQEKQALLAQKFSENVLDATKAWSLDIHDQDRLKGIPSEALEAAREQAEAAGVEGWRFTLQFPSYFPVMQYAEDRALRESMYRAYVTRASELGPQAEQDNGPIIAQTLALRAEEARLLGHASYAEVSL
ncbi:MAG: M3 family metallopeptidase, partial [Burkholderiales bacterium]